MYGGLVKEDPQSELFEMNLNDLKGWNFVEIQGFTPPPLFNHTSTIIEGVLLLLEDVLQKVHLILPCIILILVGLLF